MSCSEQRFVDSHFAGTIAPSEERTLRAHVATCAPCRKRYRRHQILARLDPEAAGAAERIGRGLGLAPATATATARQSVPASARRLLPFAPLAAALAVAAVIFVFVGPKPASEMTPRGVVAVATPESLSIFRVDRDGGTTLATGPLGRGDELAFAYRNVDDRPFLMVFAIGDGGRVYWFYPAWNAPEQRPTAVAIVRDRDVHPLPEAIRHRPNGSRLEVHALFLDRALTVQDVEAALEARGTERSGPLAIAGGTDHVTSFELRP